MPDLGKYATEVLLAYCGSIAILAGLLLVTLWHSVAVRAQLRQLEAQAKESDI